MADLRHLINPVARANARADFGAPVPQAKPLVDFSRDPNYSYGTILPFRIPQTGGPAEWDLGYSELAKGIAGAFAAPGRALQGEILAPEEAVDFALGPVEMQLPMSSVTPFNALNPTPEQAAVILRRARTFNDYGKSPVVGGSW